ncbi:hypothetical protein AB4305_03265 [Nocardia sp. 2YAB30]|uniref:hypothetical protein n=1 Tax=unclassified Nocardia TaxID=2637762 RepID=UPI003F9BB5FA
MDIDISCPHCHHIDLVQSVPALHADGVSTSYGTDLYTGVGFASTGSVPTVGTVTVERTHTTALARNLAREPGQRPAGRLVVVGLLLLFPVLVSIVPTALTVIHPEEAGFWMSLFAAVTVLGALTTPSAILFGIATRRSRRNSRIMRGQRAAHAVWSAAFYCHRCGVAFWPFPPAPNIPARQAFAPQYFRWYVWDAGGYANA